MNSQKTVWARFVLSIVAGVLFYSSWALHHGRVLLPPGAVPSLQPQALSQAAANAESRLRLARRLGDVLSDPAKVERRDVDSVRTALSADDAKMLELLRKAR